VNDFFGVARFRLLVWTAILCGASTLLSQSPSKDTLAAESSAGVGYVPHLVFDIASIREEHERDGSYFDNSPTNSVFISHGVSAEGLIMAAYGLEIRDLLKGVPDWARNIDYDISAKSDAATDEVLGKLSKSDFDSEKRHMLQGLLAERFGLRIHTEIKESTTYELVATARAAKLMSPVHGEVGKTVSTCALRFTPQRGMKIDSKGCPFWILLSDLRQDLATTVTDHTGMTGSYAYTLMWKPTSITPRSDEDWYPDMVQAVRDQLGLELRKTRGPVTSWVVDRFEHPTPN